jgi:hypothetical protein
VLPNLAGGRLSDLDQHGQAVTQKKNTQDSHGQIPALTFRSKWLKRFNYCHTLPTGDSAILIDMVIPAADLPCKKLTKRGTLGSRVQAPSAHVKGTPYKVILHGWKVTLRSFTNNSFLSEHLKVTISPFELNFARSSSTLAPEIHSVDYKGFKPAEIRGVRDQTCTAHGPKVNGVR